MFCQFYVFNKTPWQKSLRDTLQKVDFWEYISLAATLRQKGDARPSRDQTHLCDGVLAVDRGRGADVVFGDRIRWWFGIKKGGFRLQYLGISRDIKWYNQHYGNMGVCLQSLRMFGEDKHPTFLAIPTLQPKKWWYFGMGWVEGSRGFSYDIFTLQVSHKEKCLLRKLDLRVWNLKSGIGYPRISTPLVFYKSVKIHRLSIPSIGYRWEFFPSVGPGARWATCYWAGGMAQWNWRLSTYGCVFFEKLMDVYGCFTWVILIYGCWTVGGVWFFLGKPKVWSSFSTFQWQVGGIP